MSTKGTVVIPEATVKSIDMLIAVTDQLIDNLSRTNAAYERYLRNHSLCSHLHSVLANRPLVTDVAAAMVRASFVLALTLLKEAHQAAVAKQAGKQSQA